MKINISRNHFYCYIRNNHKVFLTMQNPWFNNIQGCCLSSFNWLLNWQQNVQIFWLKIPAVNKILWWVCVHHLFTTRCDQRSAIFFDSLNLHIGSPTTVCPGWFWPSKFLTSIEYTLLEHSWHDKSCGIFIFPQSCSYQIHYCTWPES